MSQGVYIDVRHSRNCRAKGHDARRCTCSPQARARVAGRYVVKAKLPKGWRQKDLAALEAAGQKARADHQSGADVIEIRKRTPTMSEWAERWLEQIQKLVAKGDYSPLTYRSYERTWRKHLQPTLGDIPVTAVTQTVVVEILNTKRDAGLAANSQTGIRAVLSGMLSDAAAEGLVVGNAAAVTRNRRDPRRVAAPPKMPKLIPWDVIRALLAASDGMTHDLILTAATTGLRRGELLGLKWEDLRFADRRIDVRTQRSADKNARTPKYHSARTVVLYSGLAERLGPRRREVEEYEKLAASPWVFRTPGVNRPMSYQSAGHLLRNVWEDKVGGRPKGQGLHTFRHTFATTLRQGGIHAEVVDAVMGHTRGGVAAIYQHVVDAELNAVEDVLHRALSGESRSNSNPRRPSA